MSRRLAVLISFSGAGGVERMVLNLVETFAGRGVAVDLLTIRRESAHLYELPGSVRLIDLGVRHSALAAYPLAAYLRRERPAALLAAKDRAIRAAARARRLAGRPTRLVGRLGTTLSAALSGKPAPARWLRLQPLRRAYRDVDHLIAVSDGVAADIVRTSGVGRERVSVIRNPVITPRLKTLAERPAPHPWLAECERERGIAVIMGAGRLTRQKDFPTLLRAFARLRHAYGRRERLLILGEGEQRARLLALAGELGVAEELALPGFCSNPYAAMRRAGLFVLSSAWEGSPNVLTEALALGLPAVATDCPSGPREILQHGAAGRLVPVGDHRALAAAMRASLERPPPASRLQAAVAEYSAARSAEAYLQVLGIS